MDLSKLSPRQRWVTLGAGTALGIAVASATGLAAAPLMGAMGAAIWLAVSGGGVALPRAATLLAQATVGVMMAAQIPPGTPARIAADWPVFAFGVVSIALGGAALGWAMGRTGLFPGTTAIWGASPGAASVMTLMSAGFGADMRLVAVMQYLRVACCVVFVTVMTALLRIDAVASVVEAPTLAALGTAIVLTLGCAVAGWLSPVPATALILPIFAGLAIEQAGWVTLQVAPPMLWSAFVAVGWMIGLRFDPAVFAHAARALPRLLAATVALIALSALLGCALAWSSGIDLLTALLATAPGGADSVAIVAAGAEVDVAFVMAMQIARFLFVLIAGPVVARALSRSGAS